MVSHSSHPRWLRSNEWSCSPVVQRQKRVCHLIRAEACRVAQKALNRGQADALPAATTCAYARGSAARRVASRLQLYRTRPHLYGGCFMKASRRSWPHTVAKPGCLQFGIFSPCFENHPPDSGTSASPSWVFLPCGRPLVEIVAARRRRAASAASPPRRRPPLALCSPAAPPPQLPSALRRRVISGSAHCLF